MQEALKPIYDHGQLDSYEYLGKYLPFDISPEQFLIFAEQDLNGKNSTRHKVNAMGNIKRAVDCRIDTLLAFWGLKEQENKMLYPEKVRLLKKMDIVHLKIIDKLNTLRNKVEHQYLDPTIEEVNNYRDVAALFLKATKPYLREDPKDAEITNEQYLLTSGNDLGLGIWCTFKYYQDSRIIEICYSDYDDNEQTYSVSYADLENYLYLIRLWYRAVDRT